MVKKHSSKQNRVYIKIVIFFLFLTLVAIFVIVHFALTKVTIKVYSNLENKTASVLVEIQPESTEQGTYCQPQGLKAKFDLLREKVHQDQVFPETTAQVDTRRSFHFLSRVEQ